MQGFARTVLRTRLVTDGSSVGEKRARLMPCCWPWLRTCGNAANSTYGKPLLTGYSPRQKGGRAVGKTKCGKSTKIMAVADAAGFPLALHVASASPHEVTLVEDTLDCTFTNELLGRLIGDKAYE